jgi:hypothetical protein
MDLKFCCKISPPDHRDYIYGAIVELNPDKVAALPSSFNLPRIPDNLIANQVIGDCTGQSSRYIKILQEYVSTGQWYDLNADFVYSIAKTLDGIPNSEGSYPKVTQQVLNKYGICHRDKYIDLTSNANRPIPSQDAYNDAKPFVTKSYAKISTLDEIKHALVEQGAVQLAVMCTDSFVNTENGFVNLPEGNLLGGHAIAVTGFDDNKTHTYKDGTTRKGFLTFVNSWGLSFGDRAYGYIPYDALTYRTDLGMAFIMEAWSSIDTPNSPVPQPTPQPNPPTTKQITLWIDNPVVDVDGVKLNINAIPKLIGDYSYIPLRFVAEALNCKVDWYQDEKKIVITQK